MIWLPGDLALCIGRMDPGLPTRGSVWRVRAVRPLELDGKPQAFLQLRGQPDEMWFAGSLFTKLEPHSPDADDLEFVEMVRHSAPV